ncbi:hypothetical protein Pelo_17717 [Pelomyxa schiedti]|nr:hypothetical protein Pelo_17717 [Pelomyxa schiedti]
MVVSAFKAVVRFIVSSTVVVCVVLAVCYVELWLCCLAHEYGHAAADLALFGAPPQVHVGCLPDDCECLLGRPSLLPAPLRWATRGSLVVHRALPGVAFSGGLGACDPAGGGGAPCRTQKWVYQAPMGALDALVYLAGPVAGALQWCCFTACFWFFVARRVAPHSGPWSVAARGLVSPFRVIQSMARDPLSRFPCPDTVFCGALSCASAVSLALFLNRAMYGLFPGSQELLNNMEFGDCILLSGSMSSLCLGDGIEIWRRFFGASRNAMWLMWVATYLADWVIRIVLARKVIQVVWSTARTQRTSLFENVLILSKVE